MLRRLLATMALLASPAPALAAAPDAAEPSAAVAPAPPASAPASAAGQCGANACEVRLTAPQLLASIERLVQAGKYPEARTLLTALRLAPDFTLQTRFLTGYIAAQEGDLAAAARAYKDILADDPNQTRVRLELGRTMIAMGQSAAADRQLRLAQQSRELDPDLARLVRGARDVIRSARAFRADVTLGIAPDTNINNATDARVVNVNLGDYSLPLELDAGARRRSGTGQTAVASAAARLPIGGDLFFLGNLDGSGLNYSGSRFDDYLVQAAAGAEAQVSNESSLSLQAIGAQRWYGGRVASRQIGLRGGAQRTLDAGRRLGVQLDIRRTDTEFDRAFDGWQGGVYVSYETSFRRTFVAAAQAFVRRDWLNAGAYSNTEVGVGANVAGELPRGFNIGFGGSVSRAYFDDAIPIFSVTPRRDWRVASQVSLGNRKLRVLDFSPQVSWAATGILSSLDLYRTRRSRFSFQLARYF
ncbi:surface lipoprotein assembly modifier [Sphingomonas sp.]|uniref:surface lipoprotein assembly modifier n=1 Tax=Sphingomonas sp. TaxID=28214 RepID=UPI0035C7907B